MKLTRTQLKQTIKEVLSATDPKEMNRWISQNTLAINDLYGEVRRVRGELEGSIEELTAKLYDSLSTGGEPSETSTISAPPGRSSGPEEPTMSEMKLTKSKLKQIIKEELENMSEMGGFAGHYENPHKNKATRAIGLLSRLRSLTTEEWSPQTGSIYDKLLATLIEIEAEIEEGFNINP